MFYLPAMVAALSLGQPGAMTQKEQLDALRHELQEMLTDEKWTPERIGVDIISTPAA